MAIRETRKIDSHRPAGARTIGTPPVTTNVTEETTAEVEETETPAMAVEVVTLTTHVTSAIGVPLTATATQGTSATGHTTARGIERTGLPTAGNANSLTQQRENGYTTPTGYSTKRQSNKTERTGSTTQEPDPTSRKTNVVACSKSNQINGERTTRRANSGFISVYNTACTTIAPGTIGAPAGTSLSTPTERWR